MFGTVIITLHDGYIRYMHKELEDTLPYKHTQVTDAATQWDQMSSNSASCLKRSSFKSQSGDHLF